MALLAKWIVMVPKPAKKIDISAIPPKVYVGTFVPLKFKIIDASSNERDDVELSISSSDDKKEELTSSIPLRLG